MQKDFHVRTFFAGKELLRYNLIYWEYINE